MNPMPASCYHPQQCRMGPSSVSEEEFNVSRQISCVYLHTQYGEWTLDRIENTFNEILVGWKSMQGWC